MITLKQLREKALTAAEKKKREEIAKAMERDNPDMPMDKKMAIATATAKRVAEEVELNEGVNDPGIFKAVFLAGGPGSGKSFIAGKTALTSFGLKVINSDDAFERQLKKVGLEPKPEDIFSDKGQKVRGRALELTALKQKLAINGRLGLVIDGTGKEYKKIADQVKLLRKIGYDVAMIFVNTDLETAQDRNANRDRVLPAAEVEKMWKAVQANLGKFQNLFGRYMYILDNSEGAKWEGAVMSAYRRIGAWTKEPPQNPAAKRWIAAAKAIRGIKEEVELDEAASVIDQVKQIASKKAAKKIGGVMVDAFTASAISQIYDKVNDANKKKMEKLPITKLADLAYKMMQRREEVVSELTITPFKKGQKVKVFLAKSRDRELKDLAPKFGDTIVGTVTGRTGNYYMVKTPKGQLNPHKDDILGEEVGLDEKKGPKIDPAKMAAHMARNQKPTKPKKMSSTQKSLASIRELSKDKLGQYIKRATSDVSRRASRLSTDYSTKSLNKLTSRQAGIHKAVDRLTKKDPR